MAFLQDSRLARRYFDAVAPAYEPLANGLLWTPGLQRRLVDRLGLGGRERVLDVGCGTGATTAVLARRCGVVHGLDLSRAQVRRAAAREDLDAGLVVGDAATLPYAPDAFDAVVSVGAAPYWPDPVRALREARRVTVPGGHLLVAGLASPRVPAVDPAENAHAALFLAGAFGHADERTATDHARRAGWATIEVHRDGPPWFPGLALVTTATNPG